MSGPRMKNPAVAVPAALPALLRLAEVIKGVGLDEEVLELIHLRSSQINECGLCVDLAGSGLTTLGVPAEKIYAVSAWRESSHFTDAERAVLTVTEQATRLANGSGGVSDEAFEQLAAHFDEQQIAAVLLNIGLVNLWNRINDATRQVPGAW